MRTHARVVICQYETSYRYGRADLLLSQHHSILNSAHNASRRVYDTFTNLLRTYDRVVMRARHKPRVLDEDTSVAHLTIDRRDRDLSHVIEDDLEFGVQLFRNEVVVTTQREEIEM
jgi:hypothetical protein